MKTIINQYFDLSRKEATACISLGIIIIALIAIPYFYKTNQMQQPVSPEIEKIVSTNIFLNDSVEDNEKSYSHNYYQPKNEQSQKLSPFTFDPNTIDENGLQKLGLNARFIKTFLNFRGKGAKFYKPEDFKKVWGLKEDEAEILMPYIVINNIQNKPYQKFDYNNTKTPKVIEAIDINTAAVNDFRQLPLVGNLAYKIVKYREKLGGFLSINQVKETYEMNDTIFQAMLPYLKLESTQINKLNINTATDFELAGHPYIEKNIAKAIVIYRTQHGNYKSVDDLKKIIFIKKELVEKIKPYLTTE